MRRTLAVALTLGLALPAWAQTATEIKKELLPKLKKAQADGKDLGQAGVEYKLGDDALKQGMQEEALEHLKKAKELWPADAK